MHRYSAAAGCSGVGNNTTGGGGGGGVPRDSSGRPDFTFLPSPAFGLSSSRRPVPLTSYKSKCDHEPLSARLGPPDYYCPTSGCPEEQLSREACQTGYREVIDGVEESKELSQNTSKELPQNIWSKSNILRYKESVRKRLRELNSIVIQKRKAGQVYGVPLTGPLLTKSGQFPVEVRSGGEDHRKKWVEDLAQSKRLKALSEHVPYGLRKHALFEALIKHGVPYLRASWSIKVIYLNQVRPMSIGMSSGGPDKSQQKRVELWTKDVLEYLQLLLDEICQNGSAFFSTSSRDPQIVSITSTTSQQASDFTHGSLGGEEPLLQDKWCYMAQLIQLHHAEGLLHRVQVVEWIFKQLQGRDSWDSLVLLLPMVFDVIDVVCMSQTYIRSFVEFALQKLAKLCPANRIPEGNKQLQHYVASFLVDILRYLLMVVPDTFVALDCFPLPPYICNSVLCEDLINESDEKIRPTLKCDDTALLAASTDEDNAIAELVESLQTRSTSLAKAVNPGLLRNNTSRVISSLDKALSLGDVTLAFNCIFDDDFCISDQLPEDWLAEISAWFNLGSGFLRKINYIDVYAVHFLCEWAVCEFRDSRLFPPAKSKHPSTRDMSRVYMAVAVLSLKMEEMKKRGEVLLDRSPTDLCGEKKAEVKLGACSGQPAFPAEFFLPLSKVRGVSAAAFFESPSLIHDMIVTWVDQHQVRKGEEFESLQLLLFELVHKSLFWPPAYVRQLIMSRALEKKEALVDMECAMRHKRILQHLPCPPAFVEEDGKPILNSSLVEALRIYRNERHFALTSCHERYSNRGYVCPGIGQAPLIEASTSNFMSVSSTSYENNSCMTYPRASDQSKKAKRRMKLLELKHAIGKFLRFPPSCLGEPIKSVPEKVDGGHSNLKRPPGIFGIGLHEKFELTPGCDECFKSKRQKLNDGRSYSSQPAASTFSHEEMWWIKKNPKNVEMPKNVESGKVDLPKPTKQTSRVRPKTGRKVSLAQLATTRIESSEATSSSHTCNTKVQCPLHKLARNPSMAPKNAEAKKGSFGVDFKLIGSGLTRLRVVERRVIARWLDETVKQLVDEAEKLPPLNLPMHNMSANRTGPSGVPNMADELSSSRWQLGEDQLAAILYFLDIAMDYEGLVKLLIWLLPKALLPTTAAALTQAMRGLPALSWNKGDIVYDIGEAAVLSGLRRYESVLTATNLLPEAVSAAMVRVSTIIPTAPGGRVATMPLLLYVRDIYKKYRGLPCLQLWEKNWRTSTDQWLVVELDALKASENEPNYGIFVGDDHDDPAPPRFPGRTVRVSSAMKEIVQGGMNEVTLQMVTRERESSSLSGNRKSMLLEKWVEGYEAIHRVATMLIEWIKQNNGTSQSNSQHVFVAVSAMVSSAGSASTLAFDNFMANNLPAVEATKCVSLILQVYLHGLLLLKEAFGERHSRSMEAAVIFEANSMVVTALGHPVGRGGVRSQFQMSPETPDPGSTVSGEFGGGPNALIIGRPTAVIAAVASFVLSLIIHGVCDPEKLIQKLKIKDGFESLLFTRNPSSNSNGISRAVGQGGNALKNDSHVEGCLFWFQVLIGDCRQVASGLVEKILGDAALLAFSRIQHLQPLSAVLPSTYVLFSYVIRRQYPSYVDMQNREDSGFLQAVNNAVSAVVAHEPFRHVCLQDTHALYNYLSQDTMDYAKFLDMQGVDTMRKLALMVPLRARLFLHSVLDRKLVSVRDDLAWASGIGDAKDQTVAERKLVEKLVQVLDDLQPATFHWQRLELRLLLNEQVLIEKLSGPVVASAAEAVQSFAAGSDNNNQLSESEKSFTELVLTRLLVRPDAALLYSEVMSHLGRPLEEFLILQVTWVLKSGDMLHGKKSLQQQFEKIAQRGGFDTRTRCVKAWGLLPPCSNSFPLKEQEQSKPEPASLEEGELAEESSDWRKDGKLLKNSKTNCANEVLSVKRPFAIERALADLALPCLARCGLETRCSFASELVKQLKNLEEHLSRMGGKGLSSNTSVAETTGNRNIGSRRAGRSGLESGSPVIGRKFVNSAIDPYPSSAAALQTSMWLRLQFLLPLLPLIYLERDTGGHNMRWDLASVLLRLLAMRVVQEAIEPSYAPHQDPFNGRDTTDWHAETTAATAAAAAGEGLFDRLLSIFHALLSNSWAVWLKRRSPSKDASKPKKEAAAFDRDLVERMQSDLDYLQLSPAVRMRLQAAMPVLPNLTNSSISAGPPQVPISALSVLQPGLFSSCSLSTVGVSQKVPYRIDNIFGKLKPPPLPEPEVEIDPWTLLEDGTGSGGGGIGGGSGGLNSNESGNLKACAWLKGAVRIRRTDLTYVGAVDDDDS